jgi:ATP-dependent Lon protease
LASFIAFCSAALGKPVQSQLAVMGDMSLGGTIVQVRNLAECMQVAFYAGAKRILLSRLVGQVFEQLITDSSECI